MVNHPVAQRGVALVPVVPASRVSCTHAVPGVQIVFAGREGLILGLFMHAQVMYMESHAMILWVCLHNAGRTASVTVRVLIMLEFD